MNPLIFGFAAILLLVPSFAVADELKSGEYSIPQTWSQETDYARTYFVQVPEDSGEGKKLPVFIFLHGNGGNAQRAMGGFTRRYRKLANRSIMVFAQGYQRSWNIVSERSKADDRGFIESIVLNLAKYSNVQTNNFTIMGSSNGAALCNQMAIETQLPQIRNYIFGVGQLNVFQHDGKNFKAKGDDNNYLKTSTPMSGKRLLFICGTKDLIVPYAGGPSKGIPAKGGKLAFVHAEESIFLWARAMGYKGEKLKEPTKSEDRIDTFSYLDGDVIHLKLNGGGHGATSALTEVALLQFLDQ